MIRPCDNCGGSGNEMEDSAWVVGIPGGRIAIGPCPRCIGMPWLYPSFGGVLVKNGPQFKPDPDTVLSWCVTHKRRMPHVSYCEGRSFLDPDPEDACEQAWIERPKPLVTADG